MPVNELSIRSSYVKLAQSDSTTQRLMFTFNHNKHALVSFSKCWMNISFKTNLFGCSNKSYIQNIHENCNSETQENILSVKHKKS